MQYKISLLIISFFAFQFCTNAQNWQRQEEGFGNLPESIQVFKSTDSIEGLPNIAYYVKVNIRDKKLKISTDTTDGRRLTPLRRQSS